MFRPIYEDFQVWYDGLTKFLSIVISLLLLGIIGIVFEYYNYKLTIPAVWFGCILLAGDWLEIYYGLIKNLVIQVFTNILNINTETEKS
jgi:hypothetical protein